MWVGYGKFRGDCECHGNMTIEGWTGWIGWFCSWRVIAGMGNGWLGFLFTGLTDGKSSSVYSFHRIHRLICTIRKPVLDYKVQHRLGFDPPVVLSLSNFMLNNFDFAGIWTLEPERTR